MFIYKFIGIYLVIGLIYSFFKVIKESKSLTEKMGVSSSENEIYKQLKKDITIYKKIYWVTLWPFVIFPLLSNLWNVIVEVFNKIEFKKFFISCKDFFVKYIDYINVFKFIKYVYDSLNIISHLRRFYNYLIKVTIHRNIDK